MSESALYGWHNLQPELTDTLHGLIVADIDGDNRDDIVSRIDTPAGSVWAVSLAGIANWYPFAITSQTARVGHFSGASQADLLAWQEDNALQISSFFNPQPTQFSRRAMR